MKIDQNNFNEINRLGDSNIPAQNAVQAALNIINAIPSGSTSSDEIIPLFSSPKSSIMLS
jgi:hypothetical protein